MDSSIDEHRDRYRGSGVGRHAYGRARVGGMGRGRRQGKGIPRGKVEQTPEQHQAEAEYHSWKRLIKRAPQKDDTTTIRSLWTRALAILREKDRDCKQMLQRVTIHPRLLDHPNTRTLPTVVGMGKAIFWLDHENYEESARASAHQKSHRNLWGGRYDTCFHSTYLEKRDIQQHQHSFTTPYNGQLQKIRAKMRNDFEIVLSERDQETLTKDGYIGDDVNSEDDDAVV